VNLNQEDRRQSPRLNANLEARLEFSVLMRDVETSNSGVQHLRACAGHTLNLSVLGLAVMLHAHNIDEQYLMGGEGSLAIELDLPNGLSIDIQATAVHYQRLDEGYLIGIRISDMSSRDRELYLEYLRELAED
jgi:PilZ domain